MLSFKCIDDHVKEETETEGGGRYLEGRVADAEKVTGKGIDGVEGGGAGSDACSIGVGDGEGDGGGGDAAESLGPAKLPLVERGLLGAGGGEDDGVPGGDARRVPHRQAEAVPALAEHGGDVVGCAGAPPASPPPIALIVLHRLPPFP